VSLPHLLVRFSPSIVLFVAAAVTELGATQRAVFALLAVVLAVAMLASTVAVQGWRNDHDV
jgi:hypothetical protein